jgi:TATA-binding protein-associated factor Taf7
VVETHKTFDHVTYFKGGDVGQMIIVCHTKEEREELNRAELNKLSGTDYFSSGLTIPTYNIVKRRFAKTRKHEAFEPEDVRRVEEELNRYKVDEDVTEICKFPMFLRATKRR